MSGFKGTFKNIPFMEKDLALEAGKIIWIDSLKSWYVPSHLDVSKWNMWPSISLENLHRKRAESSPSRKTVTKTVGGKKNSKRKANLLFL